jgi:hypothetical protein
MSDQPILADFAEHASPGSWFLSKESDIEKYAVLLPYSHYLRQAWRELNLAGVLCVEGRPTVYLCEATRFSSKQKRGHHQFTWNQGLVPLLIFLTPNQVEVHSAVKKPERSAELFEDDLSSLIPKFANVSTTLEAAQLLRSIETGQFFQDNAEFFPPNETVDRCLVENLLHAARKLRESGFTLSRAHALLGRALFVSFLQDRKFIKPDYYPKGTTCLLDILECSRIGETKQLLYKEFFPRLKTEFNGTMFDSALADEERHVTKAHLNILRDFLSGDDMQSGQMTLDFWAYNFCFIPVEIISAIYEEFMKEADTKRKRREGAYYTPRNLAETTLHVALENDYDKIDQWRVLDPACGSGIFLVAMFNLLSELWRLKNPTRRKHTKAQALLNILQTQIRGVDLNLNACRITIFSLYLALFEKLKPIDVEEFKQTVSTGFLPSLLWSKDDPIKYPVVCWGNFLKDKLPLQNDFDLVIGNPPWESRGKEQIALHFAIRSLQFLRSKGIGCLLLPSAILLNRNGTLDDNWFRNVSVQKIIQLADFRFALFEATHPCFILRYLNVKPTLEHVVVYETPKINRFDRRQGVIVVEPDDIKLIPQHEVIEASLQDRLQSLWSRKFWGTPRDETFLRRLDFYPKLRKVVSDKEWGGGVGFQPHYPGVSPSNPFPLEPWRLSDKFLPNDAEFPRLVLQEVDFSTLKASLETTKHRTRKIAASLKYVRRKPDDDVFTPPMVIYNKGFTKFAFCNYDGAVRFFDGLRSISGSSADADLLRFLSVVISSRLFKYITFHSGSNSGIEREQIHVYESLDLPFPLQNHELVPPNATELVNEVASLVGEIEHAGKSAPISKRNALVKNVTARLERLVEDYFCVTDTERILIEDTLFISEPSIHRSNLDADIPSLAFPEADERKLYADTLCNALNRVARKRGRIINAEIMTSKSLNLILLTLVFTDEHRPYAETGGCQELWNALDSVSKAAARTTNAFTYLRGFSYVESDRLRCLKPATMRNWSRTAALNDADAIYEHLVAQDE